MNNENWVKEENISAWKKQAMKKCEERRQYEKKLKKSGKKKVLIPHPKEPRCLIEKWI